MARLYGKCFDTNNIHLAINEVLRSEGSNTCGPDKINKTKLLKMKEKDIVKEVKRRLRRCKRVESRKILIPKRNGKKREITIINLYDRIAQQSVYRIVNPIVDPKFSEFSYGFRKGISVKRPVSKIAVCMAKSRETYSINVDFEKCFDSIPLDRAIGSLKELGVNDSKLLKTIKHLMFTSREYNGIGLSQGTILGPILANCFLHVIDKWVEENIDKKNSTAITRELRRHPKGYAEWLESRGRKPHALYCRYADDCIFICRTRSEQQWIYERFKEFVRSELQIVINEEKSKFEHNETSYLGFHLKKIKKNGHLSITPENVQEIRDEIKKMKFTSPERTVASLKKIIGILNFYDICNNMTPYLQRIDNRIWKHSRRAGNGIKVSYDKERQGRRISFKWKDRIVGFNVWEIRRNTRMSVKDYLVNGAWLTERENLKLEVFIAEYQLMKWKLWTLQKGKDYCFGFNLKANYCNVHHVNGNHEDNRLKNLILVSESTHRLIHNDKETANPRVIKCREAIAKRT